MECELIVYIVILLDFISPQFDLIKKSAAKEKRREVDEDWFDIDDEVA